MNWQQLFDQEIKTAEQARQRGNEGMARVCARRAANVIIQEYLRYIGKTPCRSAVQNFRLLQNSLPIDHPAQQNLSHLLHKVNPDFSFPKHVDLIQDAYNLMKVLFANNEPSPTTRCSNEFPTANDDHHSTKSQDG